MKQSMRSWDQGLHLILWVNNWSILCQTNPFIHYQQWVGLYSIENKPNQISNSYIVAQNVNHLIQYYDSISAPIVQRYCVWTVPHVQLTQISVHPALFQSFQAQHLHLIIAVNNVQDVQLVLNVCILYSMLPHKHIRWLVWAANGHLAQILRQPKWQDF